MQNLSNYSRSASEYKILQSQSLYFLNITNEASSQFMISIGVPAILCSIFNMVTILSSTDMRTKTYFSIVGVSFGDFIDNIMFVKMAVSRMVSYSLKRPMVYSQLQCLLEDCCRIFGPILSRGCFCICAVDRFLAVYKPRWYMTSYPRWLYPLLVCCAVSNAMADALIPFMATSDKIFISLCSFTQSTSSDILSFSSNKNMIILIISLFAYFAIAVLIYIHTSKVRKARGNVKQQANNEIQTKVFRTVAIMFFAYCITVISSTIVYKTILFMDFEFQLRMAPLMNTLQQLSPICDFIILSALNKDFRKAFAKLFNCDKLFKTFSPNASNEVIDLKLFKI